MSDAEPVETAAFGSNGGVPRKGLQYFVGCGAWDDEAVMDELRRHVAHELADDRGVIVIDPTGCATLVVEHLAKGGFAPVS